MRSVVVTGASSGIGRACVRWLDRSGWAVFATVRTEEDAAMLAEEGSSRLRPLLLDVTDEEAIRRAAAAVEEAVGGGLDGLVNNAGMAVPGPLAFLPVEALRRQLEVNVTGQLAVTQALLPLLRRARGRLVFVGSIGGRNVLPFAGAYCASKFALEAITDALRMELKADGIAVSLLEPGGIATPIWSKAVAADLPPEAVARYGPSLDAMQEAVARTATQGLPPETVARVVHRALTARRPRTRYLIGRMAYLRLALQLLPDRLRDTLLLRRFTEA